MGSLTALVQPQHLDDEAMRAYRARFEESPSRFVVIEDFLVPPVAERLGRFLEGEAQFATEYGLYDVDDPVDEREWLAAAEEARFFRFGKNVGTRPEFQLSDNAMTYLRFRTTFQRSDELRAFFETVTGLELTASDDFGSHSMGAGDFLRAHDDDNRNRRLALVLYLSQDWLPEYGGSLEILDRDGNASIVEARFNSLVAFDTLAGTTHRVLPIEDSAGERRRLTIGGWYHRPD